MKIAVLGDTHCGVRNSSEIFLNNASEFYTNLFFPYCKENNIKHILHLGDYYDNRKFVNFKALNQNRKHFLNPLREYGMTMDIIPGNHDTYFKNTNDLNSLKECLGHYMNEIHIIMEPRVMTYGSLKIGLVPWINSENYEESIKFIENCEADWLGAHLELNGFPIGGGITHHGGMNHKMFSRFETVLSGHFHTASQKDNIIYLGNPLEFFWSDAHDPNYFYILDTETREMEKIENTFSLFEKIVYNDEKIDYNEYNVEKLKNKFIKLIVLNKTNSFMFDRFIDRIQNQPIHDLKIAENFNEFVGENVEDEQISVEDTAQLVDSYIDAVDTDLDKAMIKLKMRELMTEAQAMEIQ